MTKITCVRTYEIDAGHRVMNHESKCATCHGHRYKFEIHAQADQLDEIGRIIDFSVLKSKVGGWLDKHWDHTFLVYKEDIETVRAMEALPQFKPPYICDFNPTAENMAQFVLEIVCPEVLESTGVEVTKIVVWETPNCFAVAEKEK